MSDRAWPFAKAGADHAPRGGPHLREFSSDGAPVPARSAVRIAAEPEPRPNGPSGWAIAATVAVVLLLLYLLRIAILPLAFAAALAFVLSPAVEWTGRCLHLPRQAAVLLVYGAVVALVGLVIWWAAAASGEAAGAIATLPDLLKAEVRHLTGPEIHLFGRTTTPEAVVDRLELGGEAWIVEPAPLVLAGGIAVAGPAMLVLMMVVLFYLLQSGRELAEGVLRLAPPAYRPRLRDHGRRIEPMLRHYLRGMLAIVLFTSGAAWLVLQVVFHAAFAVPLGVMVGVFELVPIVGPAASMVLLGTVGLLHGGGLPRFALAVGFAVGLRLAVDLLVGPLVLGRAVILHPVVVIVVFLVAASLFGVLGVLFAVPVAAATKIVLQVVYDEEASG